MHGLIVALDASSLEDARIFAERVAPHADGLKIGLELFVAEGPNAVRTIAKESARPIFLDLKLRATFRKPWSARWRVRALSACRSSRCMRRVDPRCSSAQSRVRSVKRPGCA